MRKNRAMIAVIGVSVIVLVLIGFLVFQTYSFASTEFIDDGYVLTTVSENTPDDTVNAQHYFNKGTKFTKKYPEKVVFKNVDGDKVSLDTKNFLHYQSGSMSGLTKSVILDTDKLDAEQISYYSVSNKSMLEITGKDYQVSNGGEMVSFSNFVWKISDSQYMVVSDEVKLYVSENEQKVFDNYVELQYKDEGVVYLVNQEGTYSTVSSDAYLELNNGIQIFLGSKNISDGEVVLVNMAQMVIDSDDNIEIIPDEEYKNENLDTPTINIDVEDGEPGLDGDEGQQGEQGEAGTPGDPGETGENGNNGNNGNNGSNGVAGSPGTPGGPGKPGDPGNQGESADNSDVIFNPETMPQFSAVLTTKPYGVNANVTYDNNGCAVSEVSASIIEKSSGAFVWGQNLGVPEAQFELNCDTLKQNTEYVFVISAAYSSPNSTTGEMVTQDVYKKLFVTDDLGVKLEKRYSTQEAIVLNLTKTAGSAISSVCVKYFDENMNFKGYGAPLGIAQGENSGIFDITRIQEGESVPVQFGGLEHNKAYYMQIEVIALTDNTDVNIIPTNSFPVQKFMTLKIPPEIGKPKVTLSERTNSFTIEPSYVTDPDNGIMYYRYEIYEAGDIVANPDEEPDTPTEGEEQPGTVTTPVDNTNPSLDNMLSYMDNLNISTNEEGETVIEKKENSEEQSGDGTSAEGEADSMVNIMAEPEDEPSGDTAGEPSTGDQTGESSGEPPADVTDQTGDEDWLSSLTTEGKEELLQSFQQFDDEKKTVLTSLAPMAKGTAGTSYTIKGTPVYTAEKETAAKIDVPIDGTKIRRETDYVVRIIGVFYDNEGIIEYSSPLSDVFRAGASMWPSVSNEIQDGYLTASTAEGTILVMDDTEVIQGDLWVEVASSTEVNGSIRKTVLTFDQDAIKKTGYELPYALKALKSQQPYTISVYAEKMNVNGKVYNNVVVGNASFTTTDYSPLLIEEIEAQEVAGHSFAVNIALKPSDYAREEALRGKSTTAIEGLENMGDMSAKSLTSIFFELYGEDKNGGPESIPFALLGYPVGQANLKGIPEDGEYNAQQYQFSSAFYNDGYIKDADESINDIDDFSIKLYEGKGDITDDNEYFGLTTEDLADYEGKYIYIKVVAAYDYTYGRGSSDAIYGNNNIIPIGTQGDQYVEGSDQDRYVKVKVHPIVPKFPGKENNQKTTYNRIEDLTKYDAAGKISRNEIENSNVEPGNLSDLVASWDNIGLDDITSVGVTIQGPNYLAKYSESVIYIVKNKDGNEVDRVELKVNYTKGDANPQLPEWTFFLDQGENDKTVHRGEKFTIETKVRLKYIKKDDSDEMLLYPDETEEYKNRHILDTFVLEKEEPVFSIIPWAGNTAGDNIDIFYLNYRDVDGALKYRGEDKTAENIIFYSINKAGDLSTLQEKLQSIDNIGGVDVSGKEFYSLSPSLKNNVALAVEYRLKDDNPNAAYSTKTLLSENNIIGEKKIQIESVNTAVSGDTGNHSRTCTFEIKFTADSVDDLGRIDIEFSGNGKTKSLENLQPVRIDTVTDYNGVKSFLATITVNLSDLYQLAGADKIIYTVRAYYDDGKYGLQYALKGTENDDSPYYALQDCSKPNYVENGNGTILKSFLRERGPISFNFIEKTVNLYGHGNVRYYLKNQSIMEYIPKSVSCATNNGEIDLPFVLPDAKVTVTPGLKSALIEAEFSGNNTLVSDAEGNNAELKYWKEGEQEQYVPISIKLTPEEGYIVIIPLKGLTHNTDYKFEIWGNAYEEEAGRIIKKCIYEGGEFKTLPEINLTIDPTSIIFKAEGATRNGKTVRAAFTLVDVFKADLDAVSYILLEMKDSSGKKVSEGKVDAQKLKDLFSQRESEILAENPNAAVSKLNLVCTGILPWEPGTDHIMKSEAKYTLQAKVKYISDSGLDAEGTPKSVEVQPDPWPNQPKFYITNRVIASKDKNGKSIYSINFTISGSDTDRVIAGNANKGTLVLELIDTKTNQQVSGSVRTIDAVFDQDGNMRQDVQYGANDVELKSDTTYRLMVHYHADYNNIVNDNDAVTIDECNEDVSADATTPRSASASINSMVLLPKEGGGEVTIAGVNLENTEIIKYTLRDNTLNKDYDMVEYNKYNDTLINNFYIQQPGITWNQYVLKVPYLNDPSHDYAITVEFWEKDSAKPVESKTAIYGNQSQNGIMASLTRLFSSWLS